MNTTSQQSKLLPNGIAPNDPRRASVLQSPSINMGLSLSQIVSNTPKSTPSPNNIIQNTVSSQPVIPTPIAATISAQQREQQQRQPNLAQVYYQQQQQQQQQLRQPQSHRMAISNNRGLQTTTTTAAAADRNIATTTSSTIQVGKTAATIVQAGTAYSAATTNKTPSSNGVAEQRQQHSDGRQKSLPQQNQQQQRPAPPLSAAVKAGARTAAGAAVQQSASKCYTPHSLQTQTPNSLSSHYTNQIQMQHHQPSRDHAQPLVASEIKLASGINPALISDLTKPKVTPNVAENKDAKGSGASNITGRPLERSTTPPLAPPAAQQQSSQIQRPGSKMKHRPKKNAPNERNNSSSSDNSSSNSTKATTNNTVTNNNIAISKQQQPPPPQQQQEQNQTQSKVTTNGNSLPETVKEPTPKPDMKSSSASKPASADIAINTNANNNTTTNTTTNNNNNNNNKSPQATTPIATNIGKKTGPTNTVSSKTVQLGFLPEIKDVGVTTGAPVATAATNKSPSAELSPRRKYSDQILSAVGLQPTPAKNKTNITSSNSERNKSISDIKAKQQQQSTNNQATPAKGTPIARTTTPSAKTSSATTKTTPATTKSTTPTTKTTRPKAGLENNSTTPTTTQKKTPNKQQKTLGWTYFNQKQFYWDVYLNAIAVDGVPPAVAPKEAFNQTTKPLVNKFLPGMKLEAKDPRSTAWALATVIWRDGPRLRLRFDGGDDKNDFYPLIDSPDIRTIGSSPGEILCAPIGFTRNLAKYPNFVEKILTSPGVTMAPPDCFYPPPKRPSRNLFKKGMKLEAVDKKHEYLICPASISDVKGLDVTVNFDGYGNAYGYTCKFDSRDLFPINWCRDTGYPLAAPCGWDDMYTGEPAPAPAPVITSTPAPAPKSVSSPGPITKPAQAPTPVSTPVSTSVPVLSPEPVSAQVLAASSDPTARSPDKAPAPVPVTVPAPAPSPSPDKALASVPVTVPAPASSPEKASSTVSVLSPKLVISPDPVTLPAPAPASAPATSSLPTRSRQSSSGETEFQCQRTVPYDQWRQTKVLKEQSIAPEPPLSPIRKKMKVTPPEEQRTSTPQNSNASKPYNEWTVDDVLDLIKKDEGLSKYSKVFEDNEIDGNAFVLLSTEVMLSHMGLKIGPVLKIHALIEKLKLSKPKI